MAHNVQITLPSTTGLAKDAVVNSWWVLGGAKGDGPANALLVAFQGFYSTVGPWINGSVSRAQLTNFKVTSETDPKPRLPWAEADAISLPAPNGAQLPREVAICTSFRGEYLSGTVNARRRGRVYIGPLTDDSMTAQATPGETFKSAIVTATRELAEELQEYAGGAYALGVYSRVNDGISQVVAGWVDNEFDTQRRRGLAATSRNVWSLQ